VATAAVRVASGLGPTGPHPPEAAWEAQLAWPAAYKAEHGDCSVPMRWAEDPRLGSWVSQQRKLEQKLDRGEPSEGTTVEWAARLTALGLTWPCLLGVWQSCRSKTPSCRVENQCSNLTPIS
jgi:hypothetical protein